MDIHEPRFLIVASDRSSTELPAWQMAPPIKHDAPYQAALAEHARHARRLDLLNELAGGYRLDQERNALTDPRALTCTEELIVATHAELTRVGQVLERVTADAGERAFGRRPHVTALCCWSGDGYERELPAAA